MDLEYPTLIYLKINKEPVNTACKFANTKKKCEFKPAFNGNGKGRQLTLI